MRHDWRTNAHLAVAAEKEFLMNPKASISNLKLPSFVKPVWEKFVLRKIKKESTWVLVLMGTSIVIFSSSPIKGYRTSDPLGTLLVSQSILKHGTVKLDNYSQDILDRFDWQIFTRNGHTFYSYPLGTSFYMIPFVAIANLTHMDMEKKDHEIVLQGGLAALSATLALLLIYLLARCYFAPPVSLFLTLILTFGSAVSSTLALALWNMNLSVLFLLWSLLLLVRDNMGIKKLNPYLLGFLLFSAFFCRPTTAIFIFVVMAYLFIKNRIAFFKSALIVLPCLAALLLFSINVYHYVYPSNYDFKFTGYSVFNNFRWEALYGHLLSPSRGLLVYSPFLVLSFARIFIFFKKTSRNLLLWAMFLGFVLHLYLLSTWEMWWGGGGFGYRLLSDSYPYLVFITIVVFQYFLAVRARSIRRCLVSIFALLGIFSIYVHSYQGLYNVDTEKWNSKLKPEGNEEYLFSWAHAQFLAKSEIIKPETFNSIYNLGDEVYPESERAFFEGWQSVEKSDFGNFRRSGKKRPRIWVNIKRDSLPAQETLLALDLTAGTFHAQTVDVLINGRKVGTIKTEQSSIPIEYSFTFSTRQIEEIEPGQLHRVSIEFSIPGAKSPAKMEKKKLGDKRTLGLSIFKLKLRRIE
jgi:hypothetical protein